MNPNDPWSIPPVPVKGEDDKDSLYRSVGHALSSWENFEGVLSLLFTYFIGLHTDSPAARRAYGSVVSFKGRADLLKAAAEAYFEEHPEQAYETAFSKILKAALRASPRRNDIAHGAVLVYPLIDRQRPAIGYCLVPGFYNSNRYDITGEPAYAYSCKEIDRFANQFREMVGPAAELFTKIAGKHQAQRAGRIPPSTPRKQSPSGQIEEP